jgi:hypothetical protein
MESTGTTQVPPRHALVDAFLDACSPAELQFILSKHQGFVLTIKAPTGESFAVEMAPTAQIKDLKGAIYAETGLLPQWQHLALIGREDGLPDAAALSETVSSGDIVFLIERFHAFPWCWQARGSFTISEDIIATRTASAGSYQNKETICAGNLHAGDTTLPFTAGKHSWGLQIRKTNRGGLYLGVGNPGRNLAGPLIHGGGTCNKHVCLWEGGGVGQMYSNLPGSRPNTSFPALHDGDTVWCDLDLDDDSGTLSFVVNGQAACSCSGLKAGSPDGWIPMVNLTPGDSVALYFDQDHPPQGDADRETKTRVLQHALVRDEEPPPSDGPSSSSSSAADY